MLAALDILSGVLPAAKGRHQLGAHAWWSASFVVLGNFQKMYLSVIGIDSIIWMSTILTKDERGALASTLIRNIGPLRDTCSCKPEPHPLPGPSQRSKSRPTSVKANGPSGAGNWGSKTPGADRHPP